LHEKYFHRFSKIAFNAQFGLSLQEGMYIWTTCDIREHVTRKQLLIGLHFLWRYPTEEDGASRWKMHRSTYRYKIWPPVIVLGAYLEEVRMDHRFANKVTTTGVSKYVTLFVDATDAPVGKPKTRDNQRRYWTFKNRAFAVRYVAAVSKTSGDICWVSSAYPAATGDLPIVRGERGGECLADKIEAFERIGGDGAYLCRTDPQYKAPKRKPKNKPLPEADKKHNTEFSSDRVIVENAFGRVKQWGVMKSWRHKRDSHETAALVVFQLAQVQ
jgi:hypothetical protein